MNFSRKIIKAQKFNLSNFIYLLEIKESREKENMAVINEKLLDEVLGLPIDIRNTLIEKLIESLNLPVQKDIEELWAEEADRRALELEKGEVKAISGEEVFKSIRKRYQK